MHGRVWIGVRVHLSLRVLSIKVEEGTIHELLLCLLPLEDSGEQFVIGLHLGVDGFYLRVSTGCPFEELLLLVDLSCLISQLSQSLLNTGAHINSAS